MKPMRCYQEGSRTKFKRSSSTSPEIFKLRFSRPPCPWTFSSLPSTLWGIPPKSLLRMKSSLLKVSSNITSPSRKKNGRWTSYSTSTVTSISTKPWFTAIPRRESMNLLSRWKKKTSLYQLCTERWTRWAETWLWRNSELVPPECSSLPTYWPEVLTSNK